MGFNASVAGYWQHWEQLATQLQSGLDGMLFGFLFFNL